MEAQLIAEPTQSTSFQSLRRINEGAALEVRAGFEGMVQKPKTKSVICTAPQM